MKKLILASLATMMLGGVFVAQPAHAYTRCWWTGPVRHCVVRHPAWWYRHPYPYRPYWWR